MKKLLKILIDPDSFYGYVNLKNWIYNAGYDIYIIPNIHKKSGYKRIALSPYESRSYKIEILLA